MKSFQTRIGHLKKLGLLVSTAGSNKAAFKNLNLPRFLALEDNMKKNFGGYGILHPLSAIEHHVGMAPLHCRSELKLHVYIVSSVANRQRNRCQGKRSAD